MAVHNYHDVHGRLPPAVVYGEDGRPLYSWRVLLLPYLEEQALYNQFQLYEPWDSPRNLSLLLVTRAYSPHRRGLKTEPGDTFIKVFVGKGTAFEGAEGVPLHSFVDGTSDTFLIVEGGRPVPWSKPEDLPYDPDQPLPELATLFKDGFRAAMADGSVRFVGKETSEATIRAAITRNGKEPLGLDGWPR
jgi:hypothetical protein